MGSLENNEDRSSDYRHLESSLDAKIVVLKRDLVLQLYTREGRYWEAVREVRDSWGIEASVQLPSDPIVQTLPPPRLHPTPPPPISRKKDWEEWLDTWNAWQRDLESIARSVIPDRYIGDKFRPDWGTFLSACVWFDPPMPGLVAFADLGGPWPVSLPLEPNEDRPDGPLVMLKPPIVEMGDPVEAKSIEEDYWGSRLEKMWELYLKPRGLSLSEVLAEVHRQYPEIEARRGERLSENRRRSYIYVDEMVREDDVERAFRMLAEKHDSRPPRGARKRDRLVAVECAEVYDHHNAEAPDDRRRKKWSYERLAQEYGLKSAAAAKKHVRVGREILAERRRR